MSKRRPYWQQSECPAWCMGHHTKGDHVEDRQHLSRWCKRVRLSQYSAQIVQYPSVRDVIPAELIVDVVQGIREVEPRIQVEPEHVRDDLPRLDLTITEALKLIKALTTAVDVAEGHANPGGAS